MIWFKSTKAVTLQLLKCEFKFVIFIINTCTVIFYGNGNRVINIWIIFDCLFSVNSFQDQKLINFFPTGWTIVSTPSPWCGDVSGAWCTYPMSTRYKSCPFSCSGHHFKANGTLWIDPRFKCFNFIRHHFQFRFELIVLTCFAFQIIRYFEKFRPLPNIEIAIIQSQISQFGIQNWNFFIRKAQLLFK